MAENVAVNTPIQGTAADLIKKAMIRIAARIDGEGLRGRMILQVHDELVFDVPEEELEALTALVREEMEGALRLAVPVVADVGIGDNWLEAP
jgi:DNA polymerase-1